jgi:hypothetical protein
MFALHRHGASIAPPISNPAAGSIASVRIRSANGVMLRRNMNANPSNVRLGLDDVIGDLQHARRTGDIGRLALLSYCEVRRWARLAGEIELAAHSSELMTKQPYATRAEFLIGVDGLIAELERVRNKLS